MRRCSTCLFPSLCEPVCFIPVFLPAGSRAFFKQQDLWRYATSLKGPWHLCGSFKSCHVQSCHVQSVMCSAQSVLRSLRSPRLTSDFSCYSRSPLIRSAFFFPGRKPIHFSKIYPLNTDGRKYGQRTVFAHRLKQSHIKCMKTIS